MYPGRSSTALEGAKRLPHALAANHQAAEKKKQADDDGAQRLKFAMSIVVAFVLGAGAHLDKYQHDDVRQQVGERVDGIGKHRGGIANEGCQKFQHHQKDVQHRSLKGHPHDAALGFFLVHNKDELQRCKITTIFPILQIFF